MGEGRQADHQNQTLQEDLSEVLPNQGEANEMNIEPPTTVPPSLPKLSCPVIRKEPLEAPLPPREVQVAGTPLSS